MPRTNQMSSELKDCIQRCQECCAICKETITHCLMLGGEQASADHQRILADCAQACITCVDFMLRISRYHPQCCALCADVCKECARSCDQLGRGDETMQKCAGLCRRCEQSCRSMAHVMA